MANTGVSGKAQAGRLNATFAALADPTRRAIIERLSHGEARVTDLAAPFAISLNAVSKHIKALEDVGLVRRRVAGRDHFLAFDSGPLEGVDDWIAKARVFWNSRLDEMQRFLREPEDTDESKHAK